jgi:hypothetical protein
MPNTSQAIVSPLLLAIATALFVAVWSHDRTDGSAAACPPRRVAVVEPRPARALARVAAGSVAVTTSMRAPDRRLAELAQAAIHSSVSSALSRPAADGEQSRAPEQTPLKGALQQAQSFFSRLW